MWVEVSRGELGIIFKTYHREMIYPVPSNYGWDWSKGDPGNLGAWVRAYFGEGRSPVGGFFFGSFENQDYNQRLLLLPLPFVVALFAPLPLADVLMIRRRRRRVRRVATGLCVRCGYDLRATPEKCPECGAIPVTVHSV